MSMWSVDDFAKYGEVESVLLTRIQKRSGANLGRSWVNIPHVTSFDSADITDLDAFRRSIDVQRAPDAAKLSFVAFLIKASAAALRRFPQFNASEVAILGAGRAALQPVWHEQAVAARLMLPLNLSWDHRVIDGVAAARFLGSIADALEDLRRAAL
jgi:pyruvate/2-oxoglutarate dehydrogenase complex dihydrolipoamide acyltransferase (E2) component